MADRVIDQDDAPTFRVSVLMQIHGIDKVQAQALKDTGSVIIKAKVAKPKKEVDDNGNNE